MYRNIHYDIPKKSVRLFTWDDKGRRVSSEIPFNPYIYVETEYNADAMSIFNTKLAKKSFKSSYDRKKFVESSGLKRIFYDLPAEQQFLIDMFGNKNASPDFSMYPLKIYYLDIETYSPGDFPNPKNAPDPINVITIYDSITEKFYTWGTGGKNGGNFVAPPNVIYTQCKSESDMLLQFLKFWRSDYPDIVTGWNSEGFDLPYIINRIKVILGEDRANVLSPVGQLYCRENVLGKFGKYHDYWYIKGVSHLDYMNVYKKFSREKRETYKLDHIAEVELKQNKKYVPASDLCSFSDTDWQGFVEYNIQDVNILSELENKLHYMQIVRKLSYIGYTTFEQSLGTIAIVTGAMALKALDKGMIIPTFAVKDVQDFDGGFVREPQRGLQDAIVSFDANSLYPNTIISANISPETKIGKVLQKSDTAVEVQLVNGKIYELPTDKFKEWITTEELAITKAKVLYSQKSRGFCPELLDGIYAERVKIQKELKGHKRYISNCVKGSAKYIEHNKAIVELDVLQFSLKRLMNSLYGTFGNKYSPFYDIDAAASVTLTGQSCIKEASDIVARFMVEKYGIVYDCTTYGDTDSLYITIAPVLKKFGKKLVNDSGEVSQDTYEIVQLLEAELNTKIKDWAVRTCNIKDPRFVFKRETICNSGLFLEKKRYILHVLDDEGLKPSSEKEIKYTGVEVVSIKIPKKVKPLIKEISKIMLKTRDKKQTDAAYKKAYEEYLKLDVEDIATPTGINNYEKYEAKSNGLSMGLHTPGHVSGAITYNYLLREFNLSQKYELIESGDDIKTFYVEKNKYAVKNIAFKDRYPKEFGIDVDKVLMFNKNVTPAVERLYEVVGWRISNPTKETEVDLFDLLG